MPLPLSANPAQPHGAGETAADFTSYDQASITTSDTATFPLCRAVYVGTGGNLKILTQAGTEVTWSNVQDGSLIPAQTTKVFATGTTASGLLAVY